MTVVHLQSADQVAGGVRRIVSDEGFRKVLLTAVLKAGLEIEKALGSAQDIEGVIDADGKLTVVQTRPQM